VIPATSWATPSATAAVSTPEIAPAIRAYRLLRRRLAITPRIRSHGDGGLDDRGDFFFSNFCPASTNPDAR
jgi:hypothetical protein